MKVVDRRQLTERVYKKFDGALSKLILYDALQAICEDLGDRIAEGQSVSIHNFGTFHQYEYQSRKTIDIHSKSLRSTQAFINVQFIPNQVFINLINQKRKFFNQSD